MISVKYQMVFRAIMFTAMFDGFDFPIVAAIGQDGLRGGYPK